MTECRASDALELFHRLGTYLHQEKVPHDFVEKFAHESHLVYATLGHGHRAEVAIRAARTIHQTLRRGGAKEGGRLALGGITQHWPEWLKTTRSDGDLAEAIRGLTSLNRSLAAEVVSDMGLDLHNRVGGAMRRQPRVGAELLHAIEEALPGAGRQMVAEMQRTSSWWGGSMKQIAEESDPVAQGSTFFMLARLGGIPDQRTVQSILGTWRSDFRTFVNPHALTSLLRAFASWDLDKTVDLANVLNMKRVIARFKAGAKHDLDWVDAFIGAMRALGQIDVADNVLDALEAMDHKRLVAILGPDGVSRLLLDLRLWRPEFGRRLVEPARDLATRVARYRYVSDDSSLVWSVGWLGYALRLYGASVDMGNDPPWIYEVPQDASTIAWGLGHFEPRSWSEALLANALGNMRGRGDSLECGGAVAMIVVTAARNDVGDLVGLMKTALDENISLSQLAAIVETGLSNPVVAVNLAEHGLPPSVDEPRNRLNPARERIVRGVAELQLRIANEEDGIHQRAV